MEQLVLTTMTVADLRVLIKDCVRECIRELNTGNSPSPQYEYVNVVEATKLFNCAKSTLYTLTSKRLVPYIKKGKKLYFSRQELCRWLESGRKKTMQEIEVDTENYIADRFYGGIKKHTK